MMVLATYKPEIGFSTTKVLPYSTIIFLPSDEEKETENFRKLRVGSHNYFVKTEKIMMALKRMLTTILTFAIVEELELGDVSRKITSFPLKNKRSSIQLK
eukprot:TRINITY_DN30466_c0_g1_i1.p1 TRINITY_DN30466_c0_g1~~TRINITY_DN30466_c0_g1_i1.p1  ORF type:complete len:100 (+),score=27.88 TRINITY_DN30466_c0_g1_i1:326-625(+)